MTTREDTATMPDATTEDHPAKTPAKAAARKAPAKATTPPPPAEPEPEAVAPEPEPDEAQAFSEAVGPGRVVEFTPFPGPVVPVHVALSRVQAEVQAIAKAQRVQTGPARFQFRGVDDVMNALHGPLTRHGLVCLPQVQERIHEVRQTKDGAPLTVVHLRVRFLFIGPDGSRLHAEVWGEGQDNSDKATGKAHSMAYKSAMLQSFHVPTEDQSDADTDTTESVPYVQRQRTQEQRDAAPRPVHNVQRASFAMSDLTAEERGAVRSSLEAEWGKAVPSLADLTDVETDQVVALCATIREQRANTPTRPDDRQAEQDQQRQDDAGQENQDPPY